MPAWSDWRIVWMQSKVLLKRLKRLERKAQGNRKYYVFFGEPSKVEKAKIPPTAKVIVFIEDGIQD